MEEYMCWFAHWEEFVPHKIMVEKMIGLTSSSSNMNGVIDANNIFYMNILYFYRCDENESECYGWMLDHRLKT